MKAKAQAHSPAWHELRRHELDALRVLAFGLLILYHVGMLYAYDWGWHYKSTYSSEFLRNIMLWSNQWRMCLLFLISGAAVSYMLHRMPRWGFIRNRFVKLLLPLLFGMTVIVVPQVYIEMQSKGLTREMGYGEFWLAYLNPFSSEFAQAKTVWALHITWNHLWFLMYMLSYSLIVWLLYPMLSHPILQGFWQVLNRHMPTYAVLFIPIFALYLNSAWLWQHYPTTHNFVSDWYNHGKSFISFLMGFTLVRWRIWPALVNWRWPLLLAAMLTFSYTLFAYHGGKLGEGRGWQSLNHFLWNANLWLWILTILAWAQRKLAISSALINYLNIRVYCFYIIHQSAIIVIAFYLVPLRIGPLWEPLLVILGTIFSCYVGYELVSRIPILAELMGAKRQVKGGRPGV